MNEASKPADELAFDGERFIPGAGVEIAYHHWSRYLVASRLAAGKRVLDVASGEGYGAAMMARQAAEVTGFDAGDQAVRHARRAYAEVPRLRFEHATLQEFFAEAEPGRYDLVTAFEIIEHVGEADQRALLAGIKRVLAPGGLALISTPDKRIYTDARRGRNPFHVRELYREEFSALLAESFPHVRVLEQLLVTGSVLCSPGARTGELATVRWTDLLKLKGGPEAGAAGQGEYVVAMVSADPVPEDSLGAVALLDPACKLIGEEIYNTQVALDAERRRTAELEQALRRAGEERERLQKRAAEADDLERKVDALEDVAAKLARSAGKLQDEITRTQALEAELHQTQHALMHLRKMIGVKVVLRARSLLDANPTLKRVVGTARSMLR